MSIATIRPWRGSQDRAFEELAYQLLKEDAPPGSVAIRTGNPDGGVEWYADLPDGSQWGWQAKNVVKIEDLLRAMTESVEAVVGERPNLTHLTFIISTNLPAGTSKKQTKSQRQRYEDKVTAWKSGISGADRISFALIQESDLLAKLALPRHRGREWFWWNSPTIGPEWLETLQGRQARIAGDKYRPDLQVDLPIANDLTGLGFSQSIADEYEALRTRLGEAFRDRRNVDTPFAELVAPSQEMYRALKRVSATLDQDAPLSLAASRFDALEEAVTTCQAAVASAREIGSRLYSEAETHRKEESAESKSIREKLNYFLYHCRSLYGSLSELEEWLNGSSTRALRSRLYFLVGPAGSGKTHLFLDGVRAALDEVRPAVVLHGAQFRGNLWTDVCDQLGLPPLGGDVLLGAMDSAAEASGIDGRHFVLSIDAINETTVPRYWETSLPVLRATILQ